MVTLCCKFLFSYAVAADLFATFGGIWRERKAVATLPLFWARWGFIFQNGYDKCPNIGTNTNTQADDRGQSEPWDLQRFDPSHSSRACVSVQISFRNKHHYYSGVEIECISIADLKNQWNRDESASHIPELMGNHQFKKGKQTKM